jgi:peptide/nickel transport system ATP-binding protein
LPTPLIRVHKLKKYFSTDGFGLFSKNKTAVKALNGVSFDLYPGETLGIVGESGCGKSTAARVMLRLIPATSGDVFFKEDNIFSLNTRELKHIRKKMQIIFQDPFSSIDPRKTIAKIIGEPLSIHGIGSRKEREARVLSLVERVGLHKNCMNKYPHEFSGGQRQRIVIARALTLNPELIICDEPVSALDVSIQAQVLNLLKELQAEFGLTYLFISHDLSVVKHISDRIAVMYLGKIVEIATTRDLFETPLHPYAISLLSAVPVPRVNIKRNRIVLTGDVPDPRHLPEGCAFYSRCFKRIPKCKTTPPELLAHDPDHLVACHVANPITAAQ